MYLYIYTYACTHRHYIHTYTYIYIDIHIYIYTQIHTLNRWHEVYAHDLLSSHAIQFMECLFSSSLRMI